MGSATLVAVTVTVCEALIEAGAVYRPPEREPTRGLKDQATAVFVAPLTVAVNCEVCDGAKLALEGLTVTVTPGAGGGADAAAASGDDSLGSKGHNVARRV